MATVRFSGELQSSILNTASGLFRERIDAAVNNYPEHWADVVYRGIMGELREQLYALPENCVPETRNMILCGFNVTDRRTARAVTLKYDPAVRVPSAYDVIAGAGKPACSISYGGSIVLTSGLEVWATLETEYNAYCEAIKAVETQRDNFSDGVRQIMSTYATLAPALKAWPPLWDLLPEATKEKHKEIVERKKPVEAADLPVNLGQMTGVIVANKLKN